jgi:hypothetical protein
MWQMRQRFLAEQPLAMSTHPGSRARHARLNLDAGAAGLPPQQLHVRVFRCKTHSEHTSMRDMAPSRSQIAGAAEACKTQILKKKE